MKIINWGITVATAIVIPLMLTLQSCEDSFNSDTRENLRQLTELADTNAYEASNQARVYISSGKKLSDDNAMRLKLLNIKLADKFDKLKPKECIHTIDTIITHFKRINDKEALSESFYYKGRIYTELGYLSDAIDQFKYAKKYYTPNHRFYYGYTIGNQTAYLYNTLKIREASLQEILYSLHIAYKSKNHSLISAAELMTASEYLTNDSLEKSEGHLKRLFNHYLLPDTSSLRTKATIQLANLRTKQNRLDEADSLIHVIEGYPESDDTEALTFVKAMLYSKMGDIGKAEYFYRQMLRSGGYSDRRTASNRLLEIAIKKHDLELAKLVSDAAADVDSIQRIAVVSDQTQRIDNMQFLMDSADRAEARAKALEDQRWIWWGIISVLFVGVIFFWLRLHDSNLRRKIETEKEKIPEIKSKAKKAERIKLPIPANEPAPVKIDYMATLQKREDKFISNEDWLKLKEEIESNAPEFYKKLTGMGITDTELKVSFLLKAGLTPVDISLCLSKEKSAISKIRKNACIKYLDVEVPSPDKWDEFIARS